ncbi:helix-turn-helix transcriptional regulator [Mycolicibacterium conceptionense]|uniref:helix-turn-helix transcriptional regulator n=1 Tax=Mycolicibacterium conceptionense TaxID=451644 RepID=UPI003204F582
MSRAVRRGFRREHFAELLDASGMSRGDIARLAEMSPASIHSWIRRGVDPDVERLSRVAKVLDVGMDEFVAVPDDECFPSDLRIRAGLTQVQLATAAGLSTTVLSGFERAETRWSERKGAAIAAVLGVSVDELRKAWERSRTRPAGTPA